MYALQQMAAALYLAAGIGAVLGLVLPAPRMQRGARVGLAAAALVQAAALATLHRLDPAPSLTELSHALALMAWVAVLLWLALSWRLRLPGFVPPLAGVAFLATFGAALSSPAPARILEANGAMPHAHVLLASAGLAALGLAGLAGIFFLLEHRRLKSRRVKPGGLPLPSLEALDRVNRVALAVGFPLLTLGMVTGSLWLHARAGQLWSGGPHETFTLVAWLIYGGLVAMRFLGRQGGRQAAASALASFGFLLLALVGSEWLA